MLALLFALFFVLCFSGSGLFDYLKLKRRMVVMDASIKGLQDENTKLASEIERLRTDDRYLEEVARQKFGFIREGEKVYRIEK